MKLIGNIPVWGEPVDYSALSQIENCQKDAVHVAMMADHHKGYNVPIGGVVVYDNAISPSGVGFDIGCGNKAVRLGVNLVDLKPGDIKTIMDDIVKHISFGVGRVNNEKIDDDLFDDRHAAWQIGAVKNLRDKAANQLGTVGSGNHYVDIFADERDDVWVGVHFGSRGFGHGIATHYLKKGGANNNMDAPPLVLSMNSELGWEYYQAMCMAGDYARTGRTWVCKKVAEIIGSPIVDNVHNHHNYAWLEEHEINGERRDVWVVRKGATPAFPGQHGFIGGSMGENAYIVRGVNPSITPAHENCRLEQDAAIFSTVHGAGRAMSRKKAKENITPEQMYSWMDKIELRGADLDESPDAYKRLDAVLAHHSNTIEILHTLRPLGVAMAGKGVVDPYKD